MNEAVEHLKDIKIEQYTYDLPDEKVAKFPLANRHDSKLLTYTAGEIKTYPFAQVDSQLSAGTTLLFNNTKVIHARLFFQKATGANIEVFCLEPSFPSDYAQNFAAHQKCSWICMVGNLKKWKDEPIFSKFCIEGQTYELRANKLNQANGEVTVEFEWEGNVSFSEVLEACGKMPIPPYLNREAEDSDNIRYQTLFSKHEGSVAAPTAALHFSDEVLEKLKQNQVSIAELTLHVGAGTFRPVKAERIGDHDMHTEHLVIDRTLIEKLATKKGDFIAVGTTSVRTLESLYWMGVKLLNGSVDFNQIHQWEAYELPNHYTLSESMQALLRWYDQNEVDQLKAATTIMIVPGYQFHVIDAMFTNFHQPQSTLLLLVSAAIGEDWKKVYDFALNNDFRFLSYGDSSLLRIENKK